MHSTTFKKILAPAIVLSLIGLSGSTAFAANKEGAKCTTAGKIVTVSGKKLVCAKVAKTLKWVAVGGKAVTTTTVAPTTTVAATTTTTVAAAVKPVVTLLREGGTSTSASVNYTVTGDKKDINCATLSTVIGVDFNVTRISRINSIVQTSAKVCTVNAQSIAEADGDTRETILSAATTFSIADTAGVVQTVLLGSPQSIWVTRPAP
jgi:hypothetical protein